MSASARLSSMLADACTTPRPGIAHVEKPEPAPVSAGLELSDVLHKPRTWFHFNPENAIFRDLKSPQYFDDLERDIREAGAILNPLIAMPSGLLLEGESRLLMAERIGIERLPVRIVLSPMSEDEQRKRLWLGNLSRFEVSDTVRLSLYSRIWPGYYKGEGAAPKVAEIAEAQGVDVRTVKRGKATVKRAQEIASEEGRDEPTVKDIEAAKAEKNEARRSTGGKAPDEVILRVRRVIEKLKIGRATTVVDEEFPIYDYAIELLEEALG